jgi:hypothetical protein
VTDYDYDDCDLRDRVDYFPCAHPKLSPRSFHNLLGYLIAVSFLHTFSL